MWQEAGVVVIVGGAVYYLYRKFFARPTRTQPPPSFVPLADLKRKR